MKSRKTMKTMKAMKNMKAMKTMKAMKAMKTMKTMKAMKAMKAMKSKKAVRGSKHLAKIRTQAPYFTKDGTAMSVVTIMITDQQAIAFLEAAGVDPYTYDRSKPWMVAVLRDSWQAGGKKSKKNQGSQKNQWWENQWWQSGGKKGKKKKPKGAKQ